MVSLWTVPVPVGVSLRYAVLYYNEHRRLKVLWEVEPSTILSPVSSNLFCPCPAFLHGCVILLMVVPCHSLLSQHDSILFGEWEWKVKAFVAQSCDPTDCSQSGSSVHGILQTRILEWVVILPPGDLSDPGIKPRSPSLQEDSLSFQLPGKSLAHNTWHIVGT